MPGLDALQQILVVLVRQGVDQIHGSLVNSQDVQGSGDADVRRHHGLRRDAFTVAGDRHVPQNVDVGDVLSEEVNGSLGGFCDALHELLLRDIPLVRLARGGVDPCLADAAVRTADADVLVGAAEAALHVTLEMGQGQHGVVVQQIFAHGHLREPLSAFHRQKRGAVLVQDVHRGEGPAVHFQSLPVVFRGVAVAVVVGVGLDDGSLRETLRDQLLHPGAGDDVRSLGFAGVELDAHAAGKVCADLVIDL